MAELEDVAPPSEPPPLLDFDQVRHLAVHGWLPIQLPICLLRELQGLMHLAQIYFDHRLADKKKLFPSHLGTECGFYMVSDEKEYLTIRHLTQTKAPALEQMAQNIWRECAQILHRILCDLSRAGYLDVHIWDHLVEGSLDVPTNDRHLNDVLTLMRIFRYYPDAGEAPAHTDVGLLTLCVGGSRGLQVLDQERKEYVDATGPTVLVGDMTRTLMRNRVRTGIHRVVSTPSGRVSTVFALRPNLTSSTDLAMFGGQGTVSTKEIFSNIRDTKYNINATKAIREQQQRVMEERAKPAAAAK